MAEEAGVSKALLHYYFSSRNELLARAYEYADERGRQRVWHDVESVESGSIRLRRVFDLYLSDDRNVDEDWVLWSELSSSAMFEADLRPVMEASFERWCAWVESLVRDAIDEGAIPTDADPVEVALRFTAMTEGLGSLLARKLVDRGLARRVLEGVLDEALGGRREVGATERSSPPATGYLRLLAALTRTAVQELHGLASNADEDQAIRLVCGLIDARTTAAQQFTTADEITDAASDGQAPPAAAGGAARWMPVDEVATPAVIVDIPHLDRNLSRLAAAMNDAGVAFRPDATAHGTPAIAARQQRMGAAGLAVGTTSQAEMLWQAGCRDIVIAAPVVGARNCGRVACMARAGHVAVHIDSAAAAEELAAAAARAGSTVGAQLAIDTGHGRGGLAADDFASILELARLLLDLPNLDYEGIADGRRAEVSSPAPPRDGNGNGDDRARTLVDLADWLRGEAVPVRTVAGGWTATALQLASVTGMTEMRAGAYAFEYVALGPDDPADGGIAALTVCCTVQSITRDGAIVIDAGSETLGGPGPLGDDGFAVSLDGRLRITEVGPGYGIGQPTGAVPPNVGDRVLLVPAATTVVVGLARELVAVSGGWVQEIWPVAGRLPS